MGDRTYFYATVYTYCIDGGQHIICLCNCIYLLNRWGIEHSSLQLYILHMYIDGDRTYFYATVHAYSVDGRTEHISTLLNVQLGGGATPMDCWGSNVRCCEKYNSTRSEKYGAKKIV